MDEIVGVEGPGAAVSLAHGGHAGLLGHPVAVVVPEPPAAVLEEVVHPAAQLHV